MGWTKLSSPALKNGFNSAAALHRRTSCHHIFFSVLWAVRVPRGSVEAQGGTRGEFGSKPSETSFLLTLPCYSSELHKGPIPSSLLSRTRTVVSPRCQSILIQNDWALRFSVPWLSGDSEFVSSHINDSPDDTQGTNPPANSIKQRWPRKFCLTAPRFWSNISDNGVRCSVTPGSSFDTGVS